MASDTLIHVRMKQEDMNRPDVQAFHCGSKPHETPLADWIKTQAADAIRRRWKVWLYYLEAHGAYQGPLVGYSSLTKGNIDTIGEDGSTTQLKVMEIPMLALHEDFWRCPKGITDPERRYSRQIVRHLQQEAQIGQQNGQNIERFLALYVHPDAEAAQKLYLACGFVFAPGRFLPDPDIHPDSGFPGLLGMDYRWD
jgi:ribosomal protein S18 acetylase RimI-like enzyme